MPADIVERLRHASTSTTKAKLCAEAATDIATLRQQVADSHAALKAADQALCDWANTYAHDECKPETVAAARARIREGGTLAYIAETLGVIRRALAAGREG